MEKNIGKRLSVILISENRYVGTLDAIDESIMTFSNGSFILFSNFYSVSLVLSLLQYPVAARKTE